MKLLLVRRLVYSAICEKKNHFSWSEMFFAYSAVETSETNDLIIACGMLFMHLL